MIHHRLMPLPEIDLCRDPSPSQIDRWGWDKQTFLRQKSVIWKRSSLQPFQLPEQAKGLSGVHGTRLFDAVDPHVVPNVNMLDFLLANPHEIPQWMYEGWYLYFPNPIYWEIKGPAFVRYLHWNERSGVVEEGDTLRDGYGFTNKCAIATYKGLTSEA